MVSSLRSKTSVALLVTAPAPSVPVVPPLPTCKVPPAMVVVPAYELAPVRMAIPSPVLRREPPFQKRVTTIRSASGSVPRATSSVATTEPDMFTPLLPVMKFIIPPVER